MVEEGLALRPEGVLPRLEISSFGFKHGRPEADTVLDVRFLPNPYWVVELRPRTGLDPAVAAHAVDNESGHRFLALLEPLLLFLLTEHGGAGRDVLRLAVGCTGGKHRSVAVVERLRALLAPRLSSLQVHHRDIDRV